MLEHRFGAVLLADLLLGDPVTALGDDVTPAEVSFQDSSTSPVDDVVVAGETAGGVRRRLSIGVRRDPKITASDDSTAELLVSYLRVVTDHWQEVSTGNWRLALAVASPNTAVQQVRELAVIAQGQPDEGSFRAAVRRPKRTNEAVRKRLVHFDALIAKAAADEKVSTTAASSELTWRVLHVLRLIELRLDSGDESDRTTVVSRLRSVVPDKTLTSAEALFKALERLSQGFAPTGARVTESSLRRDLSGTAIDRSHSYAMAWQVLDRLAETAEAFVQFGLAGAKNRLELTRAGAAETLAKEMAKAAVEVSALVVTGEPDAGKSALVLRTAQRLRANGAAVMVLNLREMPATLADFEARLGASLTTVLSASAMGTVGRLLIIDGAESVLEGRSQLLSALARAAMAAGLGVVTVTRSDGSAAVRGLLEQAAQSLEGNRAATDSVVREHEVPRLTSAEIEHLVKVFPQLGRWADDQRAVWLLGRLGLVDMVLRSGPDVSAPEGQVSEAGLFAVVWHHLVRRGEILQPGGPSPDARDQALRTLARRELLPQNNTTLPDPATLPSLRSDGLLVVLSAKSAWSAADRFASDLVRDMAIVRMLVTDGFDLLAAAEAPRWALRAARVACQAQLLDSTDFRRSFSMMRTTFEQFAAKHGSRWSDVPWEAVLTLGDASDVLQQAWPDLQRDQHAGLRTAIRIAMQRQATGDVGDPIVLGPLVELTFCRDEAVPTDDDFGKDNLDRSIRELVLAWLRGLVSADNVQPVPLRQRVRDRILAAKPKHWDDFAVEALAMLGPDLDEHVEAFLRGIADDCAGHLEPVVERFWPAEMMARRQPDLLLALAEAYYIKRYDVTKAKYDWSDSYSFDGGIRRHRGRSGFSERMVAWQHGPFWQLLRVRMVPAIEMINRMLDHAAIVRVTGRDKSIPTSADELPGVDLELPGIGVRTCIGDGHVWSWYRGSSVGPYPCMSALLAVERLADQLVSIAEVSLDKVVQLLLRGCNNLAMPGLLVGFLTRHLEQAGPLLDDWMRNPDVWHLEFSRVTGEGIHHVQGLDAPDVVGRSRRRMTLRDVAAEFTIGAVLAGDQTRLNELSKVGEDLVRRADELMADSVGDEQIDRFLTSVQGWAATFRPDNYHLESGEEGNLVVQYKHSEPLATRMQPEAEKFARNNEALRLQNTYAKSAERVAPVDNILADIALARSFGEDLPDITLDPLDPIAAVAAAAAVAHADDRVQVPGDDLRWAADVLIRAITEPSSSDYEPGSFYSLGADRSAATGLPALLAVASEDTNLDQQAIINALGQCTTSHYNEVRIAAATAVERVWFAPCKIDQLSGECRHEAVLDIVRTGLQDCRLDDWDSVTGRRGRLPLEGPYEQTLHQVESEQLYLTSLIPPLIAAASASRNDSCIKDQARKLTDALLDAHLRATDHWSREGYENRHSKHGVCVILDLAINGSTDPLKMYVRELASNAHALHSLLHDLAMLFTYDDDARISLERVWSIALETALDAIGDGTVLYANDHWVDYALGALLPVPTIDISDVDIDATLAHARQGWMHPDFLADLVARWMRIARREPKALDALVNLAKCAPLEWQRDTGLAWVEELIHGTYDAIAYRCWYLIDWLETIHSGYDMQLEQLTRWRRLVDGLAAAGDDRAVRLQRIEE